MDEERYGEIGSHDVSVSNESFSYIDDGKIVTVNYAEISDINVETRHISSWKSKKYAIFEITENGNFHKFEMYNNYISNLIDIMTKLEKYGNNISIKFVTGSKFITVFMNSLSYFLIFVMVSLFIAVLIYGDIAKLIPSFGLPFAAIVSMQYNKRRLGYRVRSYSSKSEFLKELREAT